LNIAIQRGADRREYCARNHWAEETRPLAPSTFLRQPSKSKPSDKGGESASKAAMINIANLLQSVIVWLQKLRQKSNRKLARNGSGLERSGGRGRKN